MTDSAGRGRGRWVMAWLWGLFVISVSWPHRTEAATRSVRFSYVRAEGTADCPDAEAIRAGVSARLGYEPFDDQARSGISAVVSRAAGILKARIAIEGADGAVTAERLLMSARGDCAELASALELAVSIAIDPLGSARPTPLAPSEASAPPPPLTVTPSPPAPVSVIIVREPPARQEAPKPPLAFHATVGVLAAWGSAPSATGGGLLQVSARRDRMSLAIEGRADLAGTERLRSGEIRTSLLIGALVPCLHHRRFGACALLSAGTLRASGQGLLEPRQVSLFHASVGGRLMVDLPLFGAVSARLFADLSAPLTETVVRVSGQPVWSSPPVAGAVGLACGMKFP